MKAARAILLFVGLAAGGYGVALVLTTLPLDRVLWLGVWLVAVVVVHDGLLAPVMSAARVRWYRRADSRPAVVTEVVRIGVVVGAVLSLYVVPEIWAQQRGNRNPTILVADYSLRLVVVWAVIGAVLLVVSRVARRRARR